MREFAKKVFVAGIVIGAIVLAASIVEWLLLVLASALLAIIFRTSAEWLSERTGLTIRWAIAIVLSSLALLGAGIIWEFGSKLAAEANQFTARLSQSFDYLRQQTQQYTVLQQFISTSSLNLVNPAESVLTGITWAAVAVFFVFVAGVYGSIDPHLYINGFLRMFPKGNRDQTRAILNDAGTALKWWLLGQLIAMAVVAGITALGLLFLGVPMVVPLAVVAGLFTFVPYVGTILSALPALLIGFTISPQTALYVALLFLIAHTIEGYVVVPAVQHRFVYLAPALILANQLLMELLVGILGVAMATPLLVLMMVVIKRLYFHERWAREQEAHPAG